MPNSEDLPEIIYAISVLVVAAAVFMLVWRKGFGSAKFKIGGASMELLSRLEHKIDETQTKVDQVNDAVNHSGDGEPSIAARVLRIDEAFTTHVQWSIMALQALAKSGGVILPEYPTTSSLLVVVPGGSSVIVDDKREAAGHGTK